MADVFRYGLFEAAVISSESAMKILSKETLAKLEKRFNGHPVDLVILVLYKGVWGVAEIAAGFFLLLSTLIYAHSALASRIATVIRQEVQEDPQDSFVHYYYIVTQHVSVRGATHLGYFVIALGLIKCLTAAALWSRSHAARLAGLIFFGGVGAYGVFRVVTRFDFVTLYALIVDLAVAYYFWKIFPKHLPARPARQHHG
jgi:uncharacterized membrane protein